jgi:hypothetical protein
MDNQSGRYQTAERRRGSAAALRKKNKKKQSNSAPPAIFGSEREFLRFLFLPPESLRLSAVRLRAPPPSHAFG